MNIDKTLAIIDNDDNRTGIRNKLSELYAGTESSDINVYRAILEQLDENALPTRIDRVYRLVWTNSTCEDLNKIMSLLAAKTENVYFKATCSESLYLLLHSKHYGEAALSSYLALAKSAMNDSNNLIATKYIVGVCRIYTKVNTADFDFASFLNETLEYTKANARKTGFLSVNIINALFACRQYREYIISAAEFLASYYEKEEMYNIEIGILNTLKNLYGEAKQKDLITATTKRLALAYEHLGDQKDISHIARISQAIDAYKSARKEWSSLNSEDDLKRVMLKLEKRQKQFADSMLTIRTKPIDISEAVEQMKVHIESASLVEAIRFLVYGLFDLENKGEIEEKLKRDSGNYSFLTLLTKGYIDKNGRTVGIVPSIQEATENDMEIICRDYARTNYTISVDAFVQRYLHMMNQKFELNESTLRFIVDNNIFVPQDRQGAFLKGLVAGFNFDYLTSMSVLMPQVENAIREMARKLDILTDKFDNEGIQEYLSLGSIINRLEDSELLEEDMIFNLRLFYAGELGYDMRNNVAHGLLSDDELDCSIQSMAVWWYTLRLCCDYSGDFKKRLFEEKLRNT